MSDSLWGEVNGKPLRIPIIGVTGEKSSGKTLFCGTIDPENTLCVDIEDSSVTYNLPYKRHVSLYDEVETDNPNGIPSPYECWEWFVDLITNQIDAGEYSVLMVDPINDLQQGLYEWCRQHCGQFNLTESQVNKSPGLLWGAAKSHLKILLGRASRKVQTFAFTTHTGLQWSASGSPIPGRIRAKGTDTFYELASLYLHLDRKPYETSSGRDGKTKIVTPEKPSGSILPPLGKSRLAIVHDGEVKSILPPRFKDCTPQRIREYIQKPPNYGRLGKDEQPQPVKMSDDERLQAQLEIASTQKATEEIKVQRDHERLEAARKADERNRAAEEKAVKLATEARTDDENGVSARTDEDSNGVQNGVGSGNGNATETHAADTEIGQLLLCISKAFTELETDDSTIEAILKKRGANKLIDLNLDDARELDHKLSAKVAEKTGVPF